MGGFSSSVWKRQQPTCSPATPDRAGGSVTKRNERHSEATRAPWARNSRVIRSLQPSRDGPMHEPHSSWTGKESLAARGRERPQGTAGAEAFASSRGLRAVNHTPDGSNPDMMKLKTSAKPPGFGPELSRRRFLAGTARGLGAVSLLGALPRGWAGGTLASDAPETPNLRFGIIELTFCSPIVIAH